MSTLIGLAIVSVILFVVFAVLKFVFGWVGKATQAEQRVLVYTAPMDAQYSVPAEQDSTPVTKSRREMFQQASRNYARLQSEVGISAAVAKAERAGK